jgi:4-hydroxybenzoate polyprenyltransferase
MRPRLLAFAQLLRLPNVFTVVADVLMAGLVGGTLTATPGTLLLALAASCSLYLAGMTSNDLFDRADDTKHRPFRPLPSGRVSLRVAVTLTVVLTLAGVALGVASGGNLGWLAALVVAIYAYNGGLKHTFVGPLAMGSCRAFNLLYAFSLAGTLPPAVAWHVAGIVGVYILGVTWFARTEEARSRPRDLAAATAVILAAVGAVLLLPLHEVPPPANRLLPYLVAAYGIALALPLFRAVNDPRPALVQAGVKRAILGLIALDAVIASHAVGVEALSLLLLYVPARLLGRWVYST